MHCGGMAMYLVPGKVAADVTCRGFSAATVKIGRGHDDNMLCMMCIMHHMCMLLQHHHQVAKIQEKRRSRTRTP